MGDWHLFVVTTRVVVRAVRGAPLVLLKVGQVAQITPALLVVIHPDQLTGVRFVRASAAGLQELCV